MNVTQKLYGIRSEPFDDPSSDHQSAFSLDASDGDDVFFVSEGPKRLTTDAGPELLPFFPPPGGSLTPSPLERLRFFRVREGTERSQSSDCCNGSFLPFSHSWRWRRYIAIVALASVTWTET